MELYQTEDFLWEGNYGASHYTDFTVDDVEHLIASYYTSFTPAGVDQTESTGYGIYNNYYCEYSASASVDVHYSYHFSMKNGYCDLCVDGNDRTVKDCDDPDWWVY